jgi:uncharacterized membrane protein
MDRLSVSGWITIASNVVLWAAFALAWQGIPSSLVFSYDAHKLLHIVGVLIFGGNLLVGPVWIVLAALSRDRQKLAFAAQATSLADIYLTTPGIQLAVWNGVFLASTFGGVQAQPWLKEALILLVVTSGFSLALVLPWQERLVRLSQGNDDRATRKALIMWSITGTLVGVPLGFVLYEMVAKKAVFLGG